MTFFEILMNYMYIVLQNRLSPCLNGHLGSKSIISKMIFLNGLSNFLNIYIYTYK